MQELSQLATEKSRRIFVAENPIDLRSTDGTNSVYVLQLPVDSSGSAGGRIGGIGERRITKLYCFRQHNGKWVKVYDTDNLDKLERLELPYHAAGLSIVLPDGTERVVTGVIDQILSRNMTKHTETGQTFSKVAPLRTKRSTYIATQHTMEKLGVSLCRTS